MGTVSHTAFFHGRPLPRLLCAGRGRFGTHTCLPCLFPALSCSPHSKTLISFLFLFLEHVFSTFNCPSVSLLLLPPRPLHRHLLSRPLGPGAVPGAEIPPGAGRTAPSVRPRASPAASPQAPARRGLCGLCLLFSAVLSLQITYCHDISPTCKKVIYPEITVLGT